MAKKGQGRRAPSAKKVGRKQCSAKGCRKLRVDGGGGLCAAHQGNGASADPLESVKKLQEIDRLRFIELDTALRYHHQQVALLEKDQQLDDHAYNERKNARRQRVAEARAEVAQRAAQQRLLLATLSSKYGFDPSVTSIDDQTGVIQEHHPQPGKVHRAVRPAN